ncbi:MAG: hypothetical protein KDE23_26015 [Caldilinea sp.]|nr:hypothetical protein [Caldilinea sp.]
MTTMDKDTFEVVTTLVRMARRPLDTGSFDRAGIAKVLRLVRKRGLTVEDAIRVVDRLGKEDAPGRLWEHRPDLPDMTNAEKLQRFAWARFNVNKRDILKALQAGRTYVALHRDYLEIGSAGPIYRVERIKRQPNGRYTKTIRLVREHRGRWQWFDGPVEVTIYRDDALKGAPLLYTVR